MRVSTLIPLAHRHHREDLFSVQRRGEFKGLYTHDVWIFGRDMFDKYKVGPNRDEKRCTNSTVTSLFFLLLVVVISNCFVTDIS